MNEHEQRTRKKCHAIIHGAATTCAGIAAGLAQIPGSDNALIVPVQVGMIVSLGAVFGVDLTESVAKSVLATETATLVGRAVSQWFFGWIPGWGNALNASTAFTVTETIGWAIVSSFDTSQYLSKLQ